MKDVLLSGKMIRRELFVALACFIIAYGLNIYAILKYSRPAVELVSTIGYVIVTAVVLYFVLVLVRLLVWLVARAVKSVINHKNQ